MSVEQIYAAICETLDAEASVERVARGDAQRFAIDKLRHLLDDDLPFHADYYKDVIRKYAGSIADMLP